MKTCPNCGTQVADDAKFCEGCGVSLEQVNPGVQGVNNAQSAPQNGPVQMQPAVPQLNPYQQYQTFDPKNHTSEFDVRDIADNKLFASCPYLLGVLGIIIALLVTNSPFCRFHAKQAIKLEIATFLLCLLCIIPFLGWFIALVGILVVVVVRIIALVNALNGKANEAPIVSEIGFLKG